MNVNLVQQQVTFRRVQSTCRPVTLPKVVAWSGEMVQDMRLCRGLSQTELAEEMGVRQQTISEWETGAYMPTRAMSTLLSIIADMAGFAYSEK